MLLIAKAMILKHTSKIIDLQKLTISMETHFHLKFWFRIAGCSVCYNLH